MQRKLLALLTSFFLLCVAAPGRSSNTITGKVHLMDYEQRSGIVLGYPNGLPPLEWFKRTPNTDFLPGPPPGRFPPSPCRQIDRTWNRILAVPVHNSFIIYRLKTLALNHLLTTMSQHGCTVNIERDPVATPADILKINPTTP